MKISSLLFSLAAAGKKRGNADLENERFIWQTPMCVVRPDSCTYREELSGTSGSIILGPEDYKNMESKLYMINPGEGNKVHLQFDTDYGFEMEWHNKCGYDKLHIYAGDSDDFESATRIARFCGPKQSTWTKPFDGSRKLKNMDGTLPMWDEEYDTGDSTVFVGVDLDQDIDGLRGFKLDWRVERIIPDRYEDIGAIINLGKNFSKNAIRKMGLGDQSSPITKKFRRYFNKIAERSRKQNGCVSRPFYEPVPISFVTRFEDIMTNTSRNEQGLKKLVNAAHDLIMFYVSSCPRSEVWDNRKKELLKKLKNAIKNQKP